VHFRGLRQEIRIHSLARASGCLRIHNSRKIGGLVTEKPNVKTCALGWLRIRNSREIGLLATENRNFKKRKKVHFRCLRPYNRHAMAGKKGVGYTFLTTPSVSLSASSLICFKSSFPEPNTGMDSIL
jgi:hypothetical protein